MTHITHADLGGRAGQGRVVAEAEGEVFHVPWEARALAVTLAAGATGAWNIDMSRSARETLPDYAQLSYYQIWIAALQRLLEQRGMVLADELAAGHMLHPPVRVPRVLRPEDVTQALSVGSPTIRAGAEAARFAVGDRVRTRRLRVAHHTRLPGYAHGRCGVVERLHGMHVFADSHARGLGEQPQWLYSVAFDGAELWGADAVPGLRVSVDAWQSYLEPA